ncbi:hypothetical protein HPB49_022600 [Dermacentor silvarum]|uniref:Uncharacterized protein n=1 Tax=Dermacentor silvarum TaxID=543639 RepID=A0ACB8D8D8_DERSI|nr:hypothetical protein HPB49_022600 [Dermacentor silvarum]
MTVDMARLLGDAVAASRIKGHNEPSFEPKDLYSMMLRVLQGFYLVRQEVHERALAHLDIDREATEKEQNRHVWGT